MALQIKLKYYQSFMKFMNLSIMVQDTDLHQLVANFKYYAAFQKKIPRNSKIWQKLIFSDISPPKGIIFLFKKG